MLLILIILVIAFAGAAALAFAVYHQNRALPGAGGWREELPREPVTLFADEAGDPANGADPTTPDAASLVERAERGDLTALGEARRDARLYQEVLNALIDAGERQGTTAALVRHIAKSDDLRGNARLAERAIAAWQAAPGRRATVEMLYVAALADDACAYRRAADLAIESFSNGQLRDFSADELLALIESQFWVLNSDAQRGGDGFALKQRLAEARRELAAATSAK